MQPAAMFPFGGLLLLLLLLQTSSSSSSPSLFPCVSSSKSSPLSPSRDLLGFAIMPNAGDRKDCRGRGQSACGGRAGLIRAARRTAYRDELGFAVPGVAQRCLIARRATNLKEGDRQTLADLERKIGREVQSDGKHEDQLDYLEELCTSNVAMNPWNELFRNLAKNEEFISEYWSKKPFKFDAVIPFAKECFSMSDLETQCTDSFYPATYAGTAVLTLENGGWMMSKFGPEMNDANNMAPLDFDSIKEQMQKESLKPSSAPLHTDKQDVIAIQAQGSKRWRIYMPPHPANKVMQDPFTRGKGNDVLTFEELEEPLLDVVLEPGQMLYVPAGYPHVTDTVNGVKTKEESIHLTLGVDTHVWDLNFACMRASALSRKKLPVLIEGSFDVNKLERDQWLSLHAPLPLGFSSLPILSLTDGSKEGKG
ncbi:hypothetical protein GUITHDRAFT_143042 [Guillardia theta CCMP2712]|uniref:Bifunctional lysine-specific demethylase and histidyl-hydroxylase n=1 Tax=Guillardia theta (strain CCMP2712) TaxID=905079 RepID=L1IW73_GUITC|nr:hypothetical protein GUITHDRAFT_143042 [Guillardia theta CCMP2712]EKX40095.1 hypothetical protein GUITHDRAFT_143042 [Guillardia theta CCMP2712]|eukprot:XP_005827075.1 hypothetical protein GUITHDRAFT_143042 [Guillardia theta CCMP2712]